MVRVGKGLLTILLMASAALAATSVKQDAEVEEGLRAYEASDYAKAIQALQAAAARNPQNGDVQLLLTKSYMEMEQWDAAVKSAERGVAIDPQNSKYLEWLGRAYRDQHGLPGWFPSALTRAPSS